MAGDFGDLAARLSAVSFAVCLLFPACGGSVTEGAPTGGGAAGSGVVDGGPSDVTVMETDGSDASTPCGEHLFCGADEYCLVSNHSCTGKSSKYKCAVRPVSCPTDDGAHGPVCGCDGSIYSGTCAAMMAGVDVSTTSCPSLDGMFRCGERYCRAGLEYCDVIDAMGFGGPSVANGFQCVPYPAKCGGTPSCACLPPGDCQNGGMVLRHTT